MRDKIGLLISHSDNYYGIENGLHNKALCEIQKFAEKLDCDILPYGPIKEGYEAETAREYFEKNEIIYLVMFIADFSSGDIMMAFEYAKFPIGIWFPVEPKQNGDIQLNAVVTANLFTSIAQRKFRDKMLCDWYYGSIDEENVRDKFQINIKVAKAKKRLVYATIGILGDVAPTFYNLENHDIEKNFPYVTIKNLTMDDVLMEVETISEEEVEAAKTLIVGSCNQMEAEEKSLVNSARVYAALKKIIVREKIDCLAAACWPDFQDAFRIVPCVIYTLLGKELHVPVACEGDIGGAITLLIAKEVSGAMPTLMDLTSIDKTSGGLLLWHCGIGSCDIQPNTGVKIINHPMLDRKNSNRELMGLSYDYAFKEIPITVLRYSNNHSLMAFECQVGDSNLGYSGTRGLLNNFTYNQEKYTVNDIVDTILRNGIEHHLIICPGRIEVEVCKLAEKLGIAVQNIEKYKRC